MDGHYTRKSSNGKNLGSELYITRMYQLYQEKHKDVIPDNQIVSKAVYRKIFNEENNFSFHIPKKDQYNICVICQKEMLKGPVTPETKTIYDQHITRKIRAREQKRVDKDHAKAKNDTMVATFDLQAVLQTPCSLVSQIYYMRKLSSYSLSIYI